MRMTVKEVRKLLARRKQQVEALQSLEHLLSTDAEFLKQLQHRCSEPDILEAIIEARKTLYDKEVLRIQDLIEDAEINL